MLNNFQKVQRDNGKLVLSTGMYVLVYYYLLPILASKAYAAATNCAVGVCAKMSAAAGGTGTIQGGKENPEDIVLTKSESQEKRTNPEKDVNHQNAKLKEERPISVKLERDANLTSVNTNKFYDFYNI